MPLSSSLPLVVLQISRWTTKQETEFNLMALNSQVRPLIICCEKLLIVLAQQSTCALRRMLQMPRYSRRCLVAGTCDRPKTCLLGGLKI